MNKTMKRMVSIATFAILMVALNAQVLTEGHKTMFGALHVIPKPFNYGDCIFLTNEYDSDEGGVIDVYNERFEKVKTLFIDSEKIMGVDFIDWDTSSTSDWCFYLSQTLFNSDEKFEYLMGMFEDSKMVGFQIMSEDGTPLQSVKFDADILNEGTFYCDEGIDVFKIKGIFYLLIYRWGEGSHLTLIYELDPQSTELKEVMNIPVSSPVRYYFMDGRQLNKPRRGINLTRFEDGTTKKVLVK